MTATSSRPVPNPRCGTMIPINNPLASTLEVLAIVVDGVGSDDITVLRSGCLLRHRFCGLSDYVEHKVGLGQHRNVAAVGLEGVRSHTLCDETLQGGLDGTVTAGNDVPARFRSPSCTVYLLIEQVCRGRCMRGPNEFLLLFWEIARE